MMEKNLILPFLKKLSTNNNREWFTEHKNEFLIAKSQMEELVEQLIIRLSDFDQAVGSLEAKKCVFRIYRDVRFAKNKAPYKTNMGAFMVPGGKKSGKAGYYLHIEPGASFLGGGIYMPPSKILKDVREEVLYGIDEFKSIVEDQDFKVVFGEISGERLKRPPKGFPADFPEIEYLKLKSYVAMHPLKDEQITEPDFLDYAADVFTRMHPFNQFINRAFH